MQSLVNSYRRLLQKILFLWVKVPENPHHADLNALKKHKNLVYVLEHQSFSDALVADHEIQRLGLPSLFSRLPTAGLDTEKSLVSVHPRPSVIKRHQGGIAPRIEQLLTYLQTHSEDDILLVPVALYWGRAANSDSLITAILSSNWGVVGRFKKLLTVLLNGRRTYIEINKPISLRQLMSEQKEVATTTRTVSRVLRVHFRHVRTAVIGPDLSHKRVVVDQLLRTEPVRQAIENHAKTKKLPIEKSHRLARKHANAIAADVSYSTIRALDILLSKLWNKIYNGVVLNGIEPIRELAKDNEIVYVPCHRSHIDYLLLSYTLHRNGLNVPHIAAGENLNMPIVGNILRRGGAFFIRRKFGGDKLYTTVFNEYIHTVFSKGYPVEYFVEGGRSRTGRMRNPATGTLAMTVKSHLRDNTRPIVFIPVYFGYEKVFESRSYLGELRGKEKKKETLLDVIKQVKYLKNYGHVYLNFGEPIKLNEMLDERQPNWQNEVYGPDSKPAWMFQFVDSLATNVVTKINASAALNPINLIATILLATPRQTIEEQLLKQQLTLLVTIQRDVPYSSYITLPEGSADDWIRYAVSMNKLALIPQKLGNLYALNASNSVLMAYYRNNVQHLFALPALVAALTARTESITISTLKARIGTVYPYVKNELFLADDKDSALNKTDAILELFAKHNLLSFTDDKSIVRPPKGSNESMQLQNLANIMLPTLERYLLTLSVLLRFGSGKCSQSTLENQSQQMAERLSLLNGLDAPEFFDKALFKTFIQTLKARSVLTINEDNKLTFDERIPEVVRQAATVVPDDIWYNVHQVTQHAE